MRKKQIISILTASLLAMACGCSNINQPDTAEQTPTAAAETSLQTENSAPELHFQTTADSKQAASGTTETSDDLASQYLAKMTLEEKIYQMFMVTPEMLTGYGVVTEAGDSTKAALAQYPVGGLIYFAQNLETQEQTRTMLANCQAFAEESGIGLFLAVDEEGGTVARVADQLGTTAFSDMSVYGAQGDPQQAFDIGKTIGTEIGALGFNVDFAPVADVNLCNGNELGGRIFSSDASVVAEMVASEVRGFQESGVMATLKHFPGLGAEDGNAHYDTKIVIDRTLDQLRQEEFLPFSSGIEAGVDFVMVSHQVVTGIGDDLPGDLSYQTVTELLKGELGFQGIAITDSQAMNTISGVYGAGEAAVMSVQAGIDIVLMPEDLTQAFEAVRSAVESGEISEERIDQSVRLILEKKEKLGLLTPLS